MERKLLFELQIEKGKIERNARVGTLNSIYRETHAS